MWYWWFGGAVGISLAVIAVGCSLCEALIMQQF